MFEESAKAGVERIAYASSVAAYGFHDDNPDWLTEDIEPRGTPEHPYSAQKAEVEGVLAQVLLRRRKTVAYAFRPVHRGRAHRAHDDRRDPLRAPRRLDARRGALASSRTCRSSSR